MGRPVAPPSPVMQEVRRLQAEADKKRRAEERKAKRGIEPAPPPKHPAKRGGSRK